MKLTLVDEHGTVVSAPEFVCDGAAGAQGPTGPTGPAGTTGQSSQTYFSTDFKSTNAGTCDWNQPSHSIHAGFPVTINVPAGVDVLITADGATQIFSTSTPGSTSSYNNFVVIDNSRGAPLFAVRQTWSVNTGGTQAVENWSVTRHFALSPGVHQIGLCSLFATGSFGSFYSGPPNSPLQSSMTVTFIAK